jgi:hypothetical protein
MLVNAKAYEVLISVHPDITAVNLLDLTLVEISVFYYDAFLNVSFRGVFI